MKELASNSATFSTKTKFAQDGDPRCRMAGRKSCGCRAKDAGSFERSGSCFVVGYSNPCPSNYGTTLRSSPRLPHVVCSSAWYPSSLGYRCYYCSFAAATCIIRCFHRDLSGAALDPPYKLTTLMRPRRTRMDLTQTDRLVSRAIFVSLFGSASCDFRNSRVAATFSGDLSKAMWRWSPSCAVPSDAHQRQQTHTPTTVGTARAYVAS